MKQPIFCFDIDGTLLSTGGAGSRSMKRAVETLFQQKIDWKSVVMAGQLDPSIYRQILLKLDLPYKEKQWEEFLNLYLSFLEEEKQNLSRILVKIGYNLKIVQTEEVSCFFSENKIVYLQTKERTFPTDFTLDELQEVLDEKKFFRVNRQYIISSDFIKNIHTSPYYKVELEFQPDAEITVSRDRVKVFKEWLSR